MDKLQTAEFKILCEINKICKQYNIPFILSYGTLLGAVRHKGFIPWDDDVDIAMLRKDYEVFRVIALQHLPKQYFLQDNESEQNYFSSLPKIRDTATPMSEYAHSHMGITGGAWVDIFVFDTVPENEAERLKFFKKISKAHRRVHRNLFIYAATNGKKIKDHIKNVIYHINKIRFKKNLQKYQSLYEKLQTLSKSLHNLESSVVASFSLYQFPYQYEKSVILKSDFTNTIEIEFEGEMVPIPQRYHEIITNVYGDYMTPPKESDRISAHTITKDSIQ